ncbi:DNA-3-methyladenine glycosylase 2 family protein [Panacibacter sp. DH6]|uniref:DNA-3-methyladenine glycosylase II n=1 Tax=Panacibacter microcysteis TaxID=2793269 RepID=A0A931GTP2_9BACT|nr:DNA-3-methyladenine glycosylase 2 family protein [Panacibacter microcysteis]
MRNFSSADFTALCDRLAEKDKDLHKVILQFGYPPLWGRSASFATLIHIILEQQVSLASAKAAFLKLEAFVGAITPENVLAMTDEQMKACYFSRQKMVYARHLAAAIMQGEFNLESLAELEDDDLRTTMKKLKGIGDWTTDVFMMMVLHRCDCFPTGDIALVKSTKEVKNLPADTGKAAILAIADDWRPYRTIAAFILWHAYIKKRNIIF